MASAKMASAIGVRIDDVGSILKFRIGFPIGENFACFCHSVWLPGSILNFCIGSVSSIGGLIAATLFASTKFQGAATKGVRQKEFDHFFSFSGRFRSLFGHFF